jgi:WD40 repeat protein
LLEFALIDGKLSMSILKLPRKSQNFSAYYISDEMDQMVLGTSNGQVLLAGFAQFYISPRSDLPVAFSLPHEPAITAILCLNDLIVAGTDTGNVIFWNRCIGECVLKVRNHSSAVLSLFAVQRQSAEIFCTAQDGSISVYETTPRLRLRRTILRRPGLSISSIRWASTLDDFILVEYSDGSCHVWNLNSGNFEKEHSSGSAQFQSVWPLFSYCKYLGGSLDFLPRVVLDVRRCILANCESLMNTLFTVLSFQRENGNKTQLRRTLSWGVLGAGGCYALHNPTSSLERLSPVVSASMYLSFLALSHSLGHENEVLMRGSCLPSLSSLSKFWIDSTGTYCPTNIRVILP